MKVNHNCFFCQEIENPIQNLLRKNRFILETQNFVAFPTVGCFQIGYLLIMPKQHFLCFGELDIEMVKELDNIVNTISNYILQKKGMRCIIFEHGTRDLKKLTSTSIMHAHIHIIPFKKDLISYLPEYCTLKKIKGFEDLKLEIDNYLYLRDINNNNYIVVNDGYPSQFFRRIACEANGIPQFWDWRIYPFVENIEITIDFYKDLKVFSGDNDVIFA